MAAKKSPKPRKPGPRTKVDVASRKPPPAPAEADESRSETQRRLLDAALGLFAERGFDGTTTVEIAARAGVAEKTLFANFGSKERLYQATLEPATIVALMMPEAVRTLAPVLASPPHDVRGFLRAVIHNRLHFARTHGREIKLLAQHLLLRPDALDSIATLFRERVAPTLMPLFERLVAEGAIRNDVPPLTLVRILVTSAVGYVLTTVVLRPDLPENEEEVEHLVTVLADGLMPPSAARRRR